MNFISPSFAQTEEHAPAAEEHAPAASDGHAPAGEQHTDVQAGEHAAEHHTFPPFDPATFGSQLFWLVVLFGLLYILMSRVALPQIGSILEERNRRITGDLAEAARAKEASDAAIAAHEQALAEARQNAHGIAQKARDTGKSEIAADRNRVEGELTKKLAAAEAEIANVKSRALADVDSIARDAVEAMVEALVGTKVDKPALSRAVEAAMAERA